MEEIFLEKAEKNFIELFEQIGRLRNVLKNRKPRETITAYKSNELNSALYNIQESLKQISPFILERAPNEYQIKLEGIVDELGPLAREIETFQSRGPGSESDWQIELDKARKIIEGWGKVIAELSAYGEHKTDNIEILEQVWRRKIEDVEDQLYKYKQKFDERDAETAKLLGELQEKFGEWGVAEHAKAFMDQAAVHRRIATYWLAATVAAAFLLIAFAYLLFIVPVDAWQRLLFCSSSTDTSAQAAAQLTSHPDSVGQVIRSIFTKAVILSGLYYLLAICTKNYRAHRHNAVVNEHRQNALQSFREFINAAGFSDETKAAVLVGTTRLVFTPRATGYSKKDSEAEAPNKLFEAAYTIAKSARNTKSDA